MVRHRSEAAAPKISASISLPIYLSINQFIYLWNSFLMPDFDSTSYKMLVVSRVLRDSTSRYVGRSVGRSVGRLVGPLFTFSAFLSFLSIRLLPRCPSDFLQHCSCPPARDYGGRVSSLVY